MENKPKLEIQLNEVATVKLLQDKCYTGKNTYGEFYLYNVLHDNVEKSFFAPAEIHKLIVQNHLRAGSEFILRKVSAQNGKRNGSELSFELVQEDTIPKEPDSFRMLMQKSLEDAVEITKSVKAIPFQTDDVQKIGTAIFIARTKSNGYH